MPSPSFRLSIKQIDSTAETRSPSEHIAGLLEDLNSNDPSASGDAIDWLRELAVSDLSGELKDQIAQGLIGSLSNVNPDLRIAALDILATLAGTILSVEVKLQIINMFISCLTDENLEINLIAAQSLIEMNDPQVPAERMLQIAEVFIKALGKGNLFEIMGAGKALTDLMQSNIALEVKKEIVALIFVDMSSPDETLRAGARRALEISVAAETPPELSINIAEMLVSALETENEYLYDETQGILQELPESFPEDFIGLMLGPLVRALGNDGPSIFHLGAGGILEDLIQSDVSAELKVKIWDSLIGALATENPRAQNRVINILLVHLDSLPEELKAGLVIPVIRLLQDIDPYEEHNTDLREEAIQLLEELADSNLPEADKSPMVEPLVQLLGDLSPEVRDHSFWALFALIESNVSEEFKLNLVKLTAGNLDVLLSSIDPEQFNDALQYLKMLLEPPELFADSTNIILGEVFAALGDANLREGVFRALENIIQSTPLTQIRNLIIEHIMDALENPSLREGAIRVLQPLLDSFPANLKPELVGSLIKCLKDLNTNVQANAARALGILAGSGISVDLQKSMVTSLIEALQASGNSYLKLNVAWALGVLAQSRIPSEDKNGMVRPLVSALGNEDPNVRSKLATTLAILAESDISLEQKEQMINLIIEALQAEEPNTREGAALALVRLAGANIPPELTAELVNRSIEVLNHESSKGRANAAWVIGELAKLDISLGLKNSMISPLINALSSEDPSVQVNAALASGSLAESNISAWDKSRFTEPLLLCLQSTHSPLRAAAALALGLFARSNTPASKKALMVEPLIQALKDEEPDVRLQAVQALMELARSDISTDLKTSLFVPLLNILADRNLRPFAIKALAALAQSDIPQELKEKMVEPLILALQDGDPTVISSAVWALARLAQSNISIELKEQMVAPLLEALKDDEAAVRSDAAWALAKLAGADISPELKAGLIEPLLEALKERQPSVQINAAQVLAALAASNLPAEKKIELIDGLIGALADSNFNVRSSAAQALAELAKSDLPLENKDQLVEPLLEALKNEDFSTRFYALEALKALVESALPATRKAALIDPLVAALGNENRSVRLGAAGILARLTELDLLLDQKDRIVTLITGSLRSENAGMHLGAATALAVLAGADCPVELKSKMGASLLRSLLDENPDVQHSAVWALTVLLQSNLSIDDKSSLIDSLILALGNRSSRSSAAKVLTALSESDLPPELRSRIPDGLLAPIQAVELNENTIFQMLRTLEQGRPDDLSVSAALAEFANPGISTEIQIKLVELLTAALKNESSIIRLSAAKALAQLAASALPAEIKSQMVDPLIAALDDPDPVLQSEAARALAELAVSDISADLKSMIADQYNKLWSNEESGRIRIEGRNLFGLGSRFFMENNYGSAAQALTLSENDAVYLPALVHICQAVSRSPSEYLISEVTLSGGLTVRSFVKRDGSEEEVHVFFTGTSIRTVMTGKAKLIWQNEDRETRELALGLGSKDLTDLNDIQINLQALFPGTFGVVTFENITSDITVDNFNIFSLLGGGETSPPDIYHTLDANNTLLDLASRNRDRLPEQIFFGLNRTVISTKSSDERNRTLGDYQANSETITLSIDGTTIETLVHELIHHWDMSATQAEWFSGNLRETDLSSIYRSISWNSSQSARLENDSRDFRGGTVGACASRENSSCLGGPQDSGIDILRETHPYGMENPREDMATFGSDFYNNGWSLRWYVRDQMEQGNFEPAAKYLFIRYFIYLGNEYGLSPNSPSLDYSEIMEEMERVGLENMPTATRNAISEVLRLHPWIQE